MGRLRDDFEAPLFQAITEEVVDLFGVDDVYLYRYFTGDNLAQADPVWGEPTKDVSYKRYTIKALFLEYEQTDDASEEGQHQEWTNTIYVAINHLIKAGVTLDAQKDYIQPGDAIRLFYKGDWVEYYVVIANRVGFVNNSDTYTGLELKMTRRQKYVPERATQD